MNMEAVINYFGGTENFITALLVIGLAALPFLHAWHRVRKNGDIINPDIKYLDNDIYGD